MNSEIWPESANTTAKLLIFRTKENRLFEAMAGFAGLALIPTQQTQAHPSDGLGRVDFETGTECGIGLFPMAAGGIDLSQDPQSIGIGRLLADGGLDLQEGGLQLTRCQESIGLEHVPIDH